MYVYLKRTQARAAAERDERARRALTAQIRADRDAARAGWAPALDPDWLRQADLFEAARAWGAAMPYADRSVPWYEPAAATAMRKCEERLRDLHPHAMARYDRLRGDGMGPAEAMREAAPLFASPPRAHDAPYTPRPVLDAGNDENLTWAASWPRARPRRTQGLGSGRSAGTARQADRRRAAGTRPRTAPRPARRSRAAHRPGNHHQPARRRHRPARAPRQRGRSLPGRGCRRSGACRHRARPTQPPARGSTTSPYPSRNVVATATSYRTRAPAATSTRAQRRSRRPAPAVTCDRAPPDRATIT